MNNISPQGAFDAMQRGEGEDVEFLGVSYSELPQDEKSLCWRTARYDDFGCSGLFRRKPKPKAREWWIQESPAKEALGIYRTLCARLSCIPPFSSSIHVREVRKDDFASPRAGLDWVLNIVELPRGAYDRIKTKRDSLPE